MPCRQVSIYNGAFGSGKAGGGYATEAECNQACKEGACCETVNGVTTCTVRPQCQCQGTGKVFKGVGTTCEQYKGACCANGACSIVPECECQGAGRVFAGIGTTCDQQSGACCTGESCEVVPLCECVGDEKSFFGIGTTCIEAECGDSCLNVKHPATIQWSVVQYPFDYRPYFLPVDTSLYGVRVINGYSASGSVSVVPVFDQGAWTFEEWGEATAEPNYIFSPADDPIVGGDGNYLRIPTTLPFYVKYTRCAPGIYSRSPGGQHLIVDVQGYWGAYGFASTDEDHVYDGRPHYVADDGRRWEDIPLNYTGSICFSEYKYTIMNYFTNEYTQQQLQRPFQDITIRVLGCSASIRNPLP